MGLQQSRNTNRYGRRYTSELTWLFGAVAHHLYTSPYRPPVTLGLIAANTALHLSRTVPELSWRVPYLSTHAYCLQPFRILEGHQWYRLLSAAFLHQDEAHLGYNMTSLLWKGSQLEATTGSFRFMALVGELLLMSHTLVVAASWLLKEISPEYAYVYYNMGAVGFSAVLFGLKVVLGHNSPTYAHLFGIALPTKYMCWVELLLAQAANPQASFLGHVCGILAGLIHVKFTARWSAAALARLRRLLRGITNMSWTSGNRPGYFSSGGMLGSGPTTSGQSHSNTSRVEQRNQRSQEAGLSGRPQGANSRSASQPDSEGARTQGDSTGHLLGGDTHRSRGQQPSMEEVRQRRLARFGAT